MREIPRDNQIAIKNWTKLIQAYLRVATFDFDVENVKNMVE
jgi:hypothetical protein